MYADLDPDQAAQINADPDTYPNPWPKVSDPSASESATLATEGKEFDRTFLCTASCSSGADNHYTRRRLRLCSRRS